MDKNLLDYVLPISLTSFTTIIGVFNYRKFEKSFIFVFYYIALGALTEILNFVLSFEFSVSNNLPIGNTYYFISFLMLGLYFMFLFSGYIHRSFFIGIIILYEISFLVNTVFIQSILEYPAILKGVSDILFIVFSVVYFHKTMVESKIQQIWKEPKVYTNLSILLYFSGSLFYSMLFNVVIEYAPEYAVFSRNYFYVLNVVFYLLIAIGFWKAGRQKAAK